MAEYKNFPESVRRQRLIDCALGKLEADLIISNVNVFHLTDGALENCNIAIIDGTIAGLGRYSKAVRCIDGKGCYALPGFIDSHVHLESSHLLPWEYEKLVLPHGTTTVICDPHEMANVTGEQAFEFFFNTAGKINLSMIVNLSSCVPATGFETSGAVIDARTIARWKQRHPESRLAEFMNLPGLFSGDPDVLAKISLFKHIDGHCPLTGGRELNACAAAGIANCHESTACAEAEEKLRRGMRVLIREGSAAKDLENLLPLLTEQNSPFLSFCSDDRSPLEIAGEGHIDAMIRRAIKSGASPLAAYRAAAWSAAAGAGLADRGLLAPGKKADIVLLSNLEECAIEQVFINGKNIAELPETEVDVPENFLHTVKCSRVSEKDFEIRSSCPDTPVIEIQNGSIITGFAAVKLPIHGGIKIPSPEQDILKAAVIERHGRNGNIGLGFVRGSGLKSGAIATTVAHDSHNICVIGSSDRDMAAAVNALVEMQGGMSVAKDGQVIARVPFPVCGLLSMLTAENLNRQLRGVLQAAHDAGCQLQEPFQQLSFLALPVIPHLKLTDRGLFDVDRFEHISV